MLTVSQLCNNRIISGIAIAIFLLIFAGMGYLYFQKYFETKKESVKQTTKIPENKILKDEIKEVIPSTDYEKEMLAAASKYWLSHGGDSSSRVILRNFGCHAALEAIKNGETVARFEYDGKTISENKQ